MSAFGTKRTSLVHRTCPLLGVSGHFSLTPKYFHRQDPRTGGRSEPETAKAPLRDMRCGKVKLEAFGRPILTASCFCASCQEAGSRIEQLPSAPPVLNPDGGTDYVLYRKKDRVQCVTGQEYLEEHRLKPNPDPAGHCHMLQFGNVPRLYQGTLADDVPEPLPGKCAAP